VLIVDDHRNTRETLAMSFPLYGCHADAVANAEEALGQLQTATYDWVVSDVRMPGRTGVELARILRERFPDVRLILMTAYELTPEETATAMALGIVLLIKPVTAEKLATHCAESTVSAGRLGGVRAERPR
jgi:CheY-like chemotaxis protein